jgi:hypothetical protein
MNLMMHLNDKGQERVEGLLTSELIAMRDRIGNIRQELWDRHGYEAYEPILRVIDNEINFRECQDAADMRFAHDAGDWDRLNEDF